MELGVLIENCPCLGEDLRRVFSGYWDLTYPSKAKKNKVALYNMDHPLTISVQDALTKIYIAVGDMS